MGVHRRNLECLRSLPVSQNQSDVCKRTVAGLASRHPVVLDRGVLERPQSERHRILLGIYPFGPCRYSVRNPDRMVGELYAATAGIGFMITVAGATFQTDKVFVRVLIFAISGMVLTDLIDRIERRFDKWRPKVGAAQ